MGSTDITVDQGGSGGSDALQVDGWPMRRVAAEARRVLLDMAAPRLGVPVAELTCATASSRRGRPAARDLRRADRRPAVQRHARRRQHRRHHRPGAGQAGRGAATRRPVAAALRHSRQGGRLAEVGRGREAAGHGARPQRQAADGRRDAGRVDEASVRGCRGSCGSCQQGQLRGGGLSSARSRQFARRVSSSASGGRRRPRRCRLRKSSSTSCGRPRRRRAARRPWSAIPRPRCAVRRRSSRPATRSRSRATPRSARRTPWPIPSAAS